jgi:geranylgeranyl transferase type-1 subunit beta
MSTSNPHAELPPFNKSKHITYWLRCLKTYLPWQYTSNDSNRMMLAYFTISALDLLSSLESSTSEQERAGYINWIYSCQHPDGGFRGFPGTDFGDRANEENALWDPANVPATYFALCMLLILRDDLTRVKRNECLSWLTRMQRPDGSFGQTLGEEGKIEGGTDTRFAYTAIGIRWILGGGTSSNNGDVNVEKLVQCIKELQVRFVQSTYFILVKRAR